MLTNETVSKLQDMRLGTMARQFKQQLDDPIVRNLSFEDRFGLLVDAEWATRKSNHMARLIKNASYAIPSACIPDVLTAKDLQAYLHISRAGAYNLLSRSDFPTLHIGKRKLVTLRNLQQWMEQSTGKITL